MGLNIEGSCCARCHAYLFSEDDVVFCPVCGAPHHRDCYNALGHCALEELHGTENQYSREKELREPERAEVRRQEQKGESLTECAVCHERYDVLLKNCPNCKAPNFSGNRGFSPFDLLGGVPGDYKLGENVTANDAKNFVMANTHKFIPKFARLSEKKKVSWNWIAFLFPCPWFLSRKMYKNGIITGFLTLISVLLTLPLNLTLYSLNIMESKSYVEMADAIVENLPQISKWIIIASLIGALIELIIRLFSAMLGDYSYKKYTISTIQKIKAESSDIQHDFRKKGGVNLFLFMIGLMLLQYLPTIIFSVIS